jgi:hypothetical protein
VRPGLLLGIGSLVAAFVIGAVHQAYTGDGSVLKLALRGVVYSLVLTLVMCLRFGLPLSWRVALTRRARARSSRAS